MKLAGAVLKTNEELFVECNAFHKVVLSDFYVVLKENRHFYDCEIYSSVESGLF